MFALSATLLTLSWLLVVWLILARSVSESPVSEYLVEFSVCVSLEAGHVIIHWTCFAQARFVFVLFLCANILQFVTM